MAFASLSILGLYEWNTDVFDNLVLPTGIDRDLLIPEIVTQCADFPLLYPDYDFMKMLIGVWSTKEQNIWTEMLRSENFQYNPIENYDRTEDITRTVSGESETSGSASSTSTDSASSTQEQTSSGTSTNANTSYNSVTFKDANKNTSSGSNSSSDSTETESSASGTDHQETSSSGTERILNRTHGNIGVTTAQQMIQGFREVSDFCTYDFIVNSFKQRFCIQVY